MALELLLLLALALLSRGYVRRSFPGRCPEPPPDGDPGGPWPRAAVIVPLTGNSPEMRGCLNSLFNQDYPAYETVLVTRDPEDPATALVRELLPGHGKVRHIISGPAASCSQKNHNLLAGVAALDDTVKILVFCDSNHQAPPHLLRVLIRPLVDGKVLTSGFHRIIPDDFALATLGLLQSVLALHLIQGIPVISQPWGGATAIVRGVFEEQGVRRLWSQNVVDDLSLGVHLQRHGIRVQAVAAACLTTHLAGQSLSGWCAWMTRQLQYLKYCQPATWLAAVLVAYLLVVPPLAAAAACLGWILGLVPGQTALVGAGFLALLSGLGAWYRTLVPQRIPLGPWLRAFYGTLGVASFSYLKTWGTNTISWRNISYRVTWGGKVREII